MSTVWNTNDIMSKTYSYPTHLKISTLVIKNAMQDTGCLGLVHWDDPEGWYGEGGGRGVQDVDVNAVNTKGQFFRASFGKNPRFQIQLDKRPLSLGTSREASGVPCLNPRRGLTLLSPVCRDPAIGV